MPYQRLTLGDGRVHIRVSGPNPGEAYLRLTVQGWIVEEDESNQHFETEALAADHARVMLGDLPPE